MHACMWSHPTNAQSTAIDISTTTATTITATTCHTTATTTATTATTATTTQPKSGYYRKDERQDPDPAERLLSGGLLADVELVREVPDHNRRKDEAKDL